MRMVGDHFHFFVDFEKELVEAIGVEGALALSAATTTTANIGSRRKQLRELAFERTSMTTRAKNFVVS